MQMLTEAIFPTLMSKTFLILCLTLVLTYVGAKAITRYYRTTVGKPISGQLQPGQPPVYVDPADYERTSRTLLILCAGSYILMLILHFFFAKSGGFLLPGFLLLAAFTSTTGMLLGLIFINASDNFAHKVIGITVLATMAAAIIGMHSSLNFSALGPILFWALLGLIGVDTVRLVHGIRGTRRKVIACIGIAIFIGFLLFDFNHLKKLNKLEAFNNWLTAFDVAGDIYVDIIALLLHILDLLNDDQY